MGISREDMWPHLRKLRNISRKCEGFTIYCMDSGSDPTNAMLKHTRNGGGRIGRRRCARRVSTKCL